MKGQFLTNLGAKNQIFDFLLLKIVNFSTKIKLTIFEAFQEFVIFEQKMDL